MNNDAIEKHLQLLHKRFPREFQVTLEESSVLNFYLLQIETSPPMIFILCRETEIVLSQKEENMNKLKVKNNIYDFGVSS